MIVVVLLVIVSSGSVTCRHAIMLPDPAPPRVIDRQRDRQHW
jgi:hypothetical protein